MRLLLKNGGELTTSNIVKENKISSPFAKKTMRELATLGIVDILALSGYSNSELKITLTEEYSWFKGDQFELLLDRQKFVSNYPEGNDKADNDNENDVASRQSRPDNRVSQSHDETKSTLQTQIKNLDGCDNFNAEKISAYSNVDNSNESTNKNSIQTSASESDGNIQLDAVFSKSNLTELKEKSNVPLGVGLIQHVATSHSHTQNQTINYEADNQDSKENRLILDQILDEIRNANGLVVSVATVLEFAYRRYESVRIYIGEKLTQRENRKVRQLYLAIIHTKDIEVVKHKPQLLVKWRTLEGYSHARGDLT